MELRVMKLWSEPKQCVVFAKSESVADDVRIIMQWENGITSMWVAYYRPGLGWCSDRKKFGLRIDIPDDLFQEVPEGTAYPVYDLTPEDWGVFNNRVEPARR